MEALLGLFLIVVVFALLSGAGRSRESERPAARSERPANSQAAAAPQEGGIGSLWPALIVLMTIAALMYNVR